MRLSLFEGYFHMIVEFIHLPNFFKTDNVDVNNVRFDDFFERSETLIFVFDCSLAN